MDGEPYGYRNHFTPIPRLTVCFAGQTLALVGGGVVWEERVLLVVAVNRTGSYDVVLVLAH